MAIRGGRGGFGMTGGGLTLALADDFYSDDASVGSGEAGYSLTIL